MSRLEVLVLGGLTARVGDTAIELGTPKQRAVFAMLALNAGQLVTVDELVDELWPDGPPPSAVANVRSYAGRLRRMVSDQSRGSQVQRLAKGYRLDIEGGSVDLVDFFADITAARRCLQRAEQEDAAALLRVAIDRWKGPVLAGVPLGPVMTARANAADEERLLAVELLAEVQLELGQPRDVIPMLREVSEIHPLRERVQTLLMRALQEHGETAAALAVYRATRTALQDELGLKPGQELQSLYEQLTTPATERFGATASKRPAADARPDRKPAGSADPVHGSEIADWLPWSVPRFIGRDEVVQRLLDRTRRAGDEAPAVHLIDGMPGSGKTTLAVHVARLLAPSCPDALLYIDLRGHGAAAPVEPAEALVVLLRQLGLPGGRIPVHLDERIELWRRTIGTRRAVVVLDNAADEEQIAPLLPTVPGSVVLITSRRRLVGIDVGPPESLPPMSEMEAVELLAASVGRQRVEEEPAAAADLVRRCGYLPLAVRLAGARLAHRKTRRIAELARQLADSPVLHELRAGNTTVIGAFAASYEPLDPSQQKAFRLLGVHPGHYSIPMVAAMTGLSHTAATNVLDELVDRNLVEETEEGRFRLHDLVRHFAAEQSRASDSAEVRSAAVEQLLDLALHASLRAGEALNETVTARSEVPHSEPLRPDLIHVVGVEGAEWLERERGELVMLVRLAAELQLDAYAWKLARALWRFFYVRGYFDDIITTQQLGLTAAQRLGDRTAVVLMCNYLASGLVKTGRYPAARRCLETATDICRETGNVEQIAKLRANQAVVHWLSGELEEAVGLGTEILRDREADTRSRLAYVLPNLGLAMTTLGRYEDALRIHRLDLFRARSVGDQFHLASALSHIAAVRVRMGQVAPVIRLLRASLRLYERTGHRYGEADARNLLGVAYRTGGRLDEARHQHRLALDLAEDCGERPAQCAALNDLGMTLAAGGASDAVRRMHERALSLATRMAHPYEQGRALAGLAEHAVAKDPDEARRYWERALAIFRRMGVPERFEVERRLAEAAGEAAGPR